MNSLVRWGLQSLLFLAIGSMARAETIHTLPVLSYHPQTPINGKYPDFQTAEEALAALRADYDAKV